MDDTATTVTEPTAPLSGTTLATLGFLMAAAGPILLIIASALFGLSLEDTAFFVLPAVLGLVGAALVRTRSTVAKVIAIVLAVVIAMTVFWTAFGLALPDSFFDFVPGLLVLPGVLLAIVATIVSIRSKTRERREGAGARRAAAAIVGAVGLLAVVSAVLTVTGRDTVPEAAAAEADLTIDVHDFEFGDLHEDGYDVEAGATILVTNDDPLFHTFTVDALGIEEDLGPGDEVLVTLPEDSGAFVLFCEPHTSDPDEPTEDDMASELRIG